MAEALPRPTEPAPALLREMILQNQEAAEAGHHRLRVDCRRLEGDVEQIRRDMAEIRGQGARAEQRAEQALVDASRLRLPVRDVGVIVSILLGVAGSFWAATYGLRSDVRDIVTQMAAQREMATARAKLEEERAAVLRDSIEAMKRRQELQQYEIQGMKEIILKQERK